MGNIESWFESEPKAANSAPRWSDPNGAGAARTWEDIPLEYRLLPANIRIRDGDGGGPNKKGEDDDYTPWIIGGALAILVVAAFK